MKKRIILSLLTATALASCNIAAPPPQTSGIASPGLWHRLTSKDDVQAGPLEEGETASVDQNWWLHFGDPTLSALVGEALANNKTIAIARARVKEARANRGAARALLFPQVTAEGNALRGNEGFATNDETVGYAGADFAAAWEVDLFGRNQANTRAAAALLQSQEASQHAVTVGLLAELARNYFDYRNDERQIALTRQNLESQQKTLDLIQAQLKGDYASGFDVQRAAAQVSTTAALIPALETQRDAALNRINVLLGQPPGTRDAALAQSIDAAQQPLDQHILVAAPATVLATRPDISVAERQFAASIAATQAARADLFPDISLTALFGLQTETSFNANPWAIGANLTQPVLNFGRIRSEIKAADARQQQAFLNYQETVLEALEDMENALSSYLHETARNASLAAGVTQNQKATDMAKQQYEAGFTGLLDLLIQQRQLLDAESAQAASDADLRKDLVNIYTAAGGGWAVAPAAATKQ